MTSDDVGESADIVITTYADRPDHVESAYDMDESWPFFMKNDKVAAALLSGVIEAFPTSACSPRSTGSRWPVGWPRSSPCTPSDARESCPPAAGTGY